MMKARNKIYCNRVIPNTLLPKYPIFPIVQEAKLCKSTHIIVVGRRICTLYGEF